MLESERTDWPEARGRTLFCKGLTKEVTKSLLYELFLTAGPIQSVHVPAAPRDKDTGGGQPGDSTAKKTRVGHGGDSKGKKRRSRGRVGQGVVHSPRKLRSKEEGCNMTRSSGTVGREVVHSPRKLLSSDRVGKEVATVTKKTRSDCRVDQEFIETSGKTRSHSDVGHEVGDPTRKTRSSVEIGQKVDETTKKTETDDGVIEEISETARDTPSSGKIGQEVAAVISFDDVDNAEGSEEGEIKDDEESSDTAPSCGSGEEKPFTLEDKILFRYKEIEHQGFAFILFHHKQSVEYAIKIFRGTKLFGKPIAMHPARPMVAPNEGEGKSSTSKESSRLGVGRGAGFNREFGASKERDHSAKGRRAESRRSKERDHSAKGWRAESRTSKERCRLDVGRGAGVNKESGLQVRGQGRGRLVAGDNRSVVEERVVADSATERRHLNQEHDDPAKHGRGPMCRTMIFQQSVAETTRAEFYPRRATLSEDFRRSLALRARITEMDLRDRLRSRTQKPIMEPGNFLSLACSRPRPDGGNKERISPKPRQAVQPPGFKTVRQGPDVEGPPGTSSVSDVNDNQKRSSRGTSWSKQRFQQYEAKAVRQVPDREPLSMTFVGNNQARDSSKPRKTFRQYEAKSDRYTPGREAVLISDYLPVSYQQKQNRGNQKTKTDGSQVEDVDEGESPRSSTNPAKGGRSKRHRRKRKVVEAANPSPSPAQVPVIDHPRPYTRGQLEE